MEEKNKIEVPIWEKAALTIVEASAYSNIGTNTIRRLLKNPRCEFALHIGQGRTLVKRREFVDFISRSIEI